VFSFDQTAGSFATHTRTMPGDPRECRVHAANCAAAATTAKTAHLRATFLGLSKHWEQLAKELEIAQVLQDELNVDFPKSA
jgi:hypothetical protein